MSDAARPSGFGARLRRTLVRPLPLVTYLLLTTETHAFCAALAFFALIAFYPAMSLLLALARDVLHGDAAQEVILLAVREYYPQSQEFLLRNLRLSVALHGREIGLHAFWMLLGAAGVFIPLETAFNRLWGLSEHRPYWRNQVVGFLLTTVSGVLAVLCVLLTAGLHALVAGLGLPGMVDGVMRSLSLRGAALVFFTLAIFLFYRFLPNGRVRTADVLPAALVAGVTAELVRCAYSFVLPLLELQRTQGPYYVSVSFVLLAYVEAFVLLGGAFLAADVAAVPVEGAAPVGPAVTNGPPPPC